MAIRSRARTSDAPMVLLTRLMLVLIIAAIVPTGGAIAQAPTLVKDIIPGPGSSSPLELTAAGNKVFFTPADDGSGQYRNLWVSDGTEAGTYRLLWVTQDPTTGEGASQLFEAGNTLYFRAYDEINSLDLWKSVPSTGYTSLVQDISPTGIAGQFTFPRCEFGGSLFFVADDGSHGQEPWITNGTYAQMIADIQTPGSSAPWGGAEYSGFLFFTAQTAAHGAELWMSDAGLTTVEVADIWPGATGSNPNSHTVAGGYLFFEAITAAEGRELWLVDDNWVVDLVRDISPGTGHSYPYGLTAVGDTLFFFADDGEHGRELWKSDGSEVGTVMVRDIRDGAQGSILSPGDIPPQTWAGTDELFFFVADDGQHGQELWVSDGTAAGTRIVRDIYPGTGGTFPPALFVAIGDKLYFRAEEPAGIGVWVSDGTAAGTEELTGSIVGLSWVASIVDGGDLYFVASQTSTGQELWKLPLPLFEDGFESGDTSAWSDTVP